MEEWKEYKISEIIEEIAMGPFGSNIKVDNFIDFGIPVLNGSNLQGFKLNEDSFNYVSEEKADSLGKANASRGDVVITHRGTLGQIVYIPLDSKYERYVISQSQFRLRLNQNIIRPDFFVYFFHTRIGQHRILMNASQVGVPALARPTSTFKEITIPVPPMEIQNRVMAILLSLDDKIELNHCINENLAQQAQALFKSWFVDFEPFQDGKFVNSELGMIPEGWKVGTLSDIIKNTISGDWGKEHPQGNHIRKVFCIRGADIPDIKIGNKGNMPTRFILEKNYQSKVLIDGDMVIEISGGSPTQSTGRACRISNRLLDKYNNSIICTNFCKAIKPLSGYSSFLYYIWEMLYNQGVMFSYENGTTGIKNLDINGFIQKEQIIIPPIHIATDFEKMIKVFYDKIQSNGMQSERLAQLRDTLLPKLMSGELKINDFNN